ncbi:DUF4180 domain-containing protein [Deinococcus sp.]|uniref:DUF4180 domain-containing protein n=1 Tax=Deinococcus sp. TaxID=47478 RepID=UPI003C7EC30D
MSGTDEVQIRSAGALGLSIETVADVHALIGAAYGLDGLILHETDFGPEFFRLGSGLAGELFQKFVNYRLPVALVLPDFAAHGERFAELAWEHSRHPQVRFVHSEQEARAWLVSLLQ